MLSKAMCVNHLLGRFHKILFRILIGGIIATLLMLFQPSTAHAEYGDIVLNKRAQAAGMRPVIFPHWFHRIRYRCHVCHYVDPLSQNDAGFEMRAGSNDIRMLDILEGRFCGMCHNNTIAWGPENCNICHAGIPGLPSGATGTDKTLGPGKW